MVYHSQSRSVDSYDELAWFYDRHWSGHYHPWAIEVLDSALLDGLPIGSRVLDLCCGNGVIAGALSERGYRVVGLDASPKMLDRAKRNAPGAEFVCADARAFAFEQRFDAAFSTFDSLNHILTAEDLLSAFRNVRRCLKPGARFVFDVNLEGAYTVGWNESCASVDDEHACFIRGRYDRSIRLAETMITLFRNGKAWTRTDITLHQRFYPDNELLTLLRGAGFESARFCNPLDEFGITGPFSNGRGVVVAEATRAVRHLSVVDQAKSSNDRRV